MPFNQILQDLVERVGNAYGAVFIDDEGEPISHATNGYGMEIDTLDFIGARQGLLMSQLRRLADVTFQGAPRSVTLEGGRLTILTRPVEENYILVLVVDPHSLSARASFEMKRTVRELCEAI